MRKGVAWSVVWGIVAATVGACGAGASAPAPAPSLSAEQYDCRAAGPPPRRASALPHCMSDFDCKDKLVVGHRAAGGNFSLYAPENGLSAIRLAILFGVDGIEVDVRHTADEQLVVLHDASLKRTTGMEVAVTELSASQATAVPLLTEGYLGEFGCEHIPSFAEVLELARDRVFIIVDTKTSRGDLVALALRDAGMLDGAIVSVSNIETALAARRAVPEVRVQLRPDTLDEYQEMLTHFDRPPEIIEIPEREIANFLPTAAEVRAKLFVDVFTRDADAFGAGNLTQYNAPHTAGADIVQTEFPMWVLQAQGRDYWAELPTPRDLGLDSPLLRR